MNIADVSVIIPHYNAIGTVEASILSVIAQSLRVKEIIIVDDCSNEYEQLCAIVAKLNKRFPIELVRLGLNSGASEARNHGAKLATGKYLAFLDSDDVWRADKVEIQYAVMERENVHLSAHSYVHDLNVGSMGTLRLPHITAVPTTRFVFGNPFFTPTVMVRRFGFIEFDTRYRRVDDYKCWLMNVRGRPGALIGLPLAGGFKSPIGASGLTSSIRVMHDSYITVLNDLYREGHIGLAFFVTARVIEQLKYPIRWGRNQLQRRSRVFGS